MEQLVGKLSFRVHQLNVKVETKTLDNVFLTAVVSVQYQVLRDKIYEAFYSLTNPAQQITAHVYDVMRSQLPTLELDAVFEAKEELALDVKNALVDTMTLYGYTIVQVLITDLDPDQRVKVRAGTCLLRMLSVACLREAYISLVLPFSRLCFSCQDAMNEINSSKRLKYAVAEKAEGNKVVKVKAAEAEAESKYLSGVGVAKQRQAIVDGLRTSIVDFKGTICPID
jgi:regulator of protease activity HflC (stomatin/prohibitin superfamily)